MEGESSSDHACTPRNRPGASLFPQDIRIEDVREAIKDRVDFKELTFPDHSIFIYFLGMAKDIFPDPETAPDERTRLLWQLRRECRGIVFSTQTGKVISRRFHKFFNVNEVEEAKAEKIDLSQPFVVLEKLDGSMVSPYYTEGQLRFCTKQGVTDASLLAEAFINAEPEDQGDRKKSLYKEFSAEWIERGYTPIYEWCSNKTRVVLDYPTDSLTLVCLRHMHSGDYLSYAETKKVAEEYGIPVVKAYTLEELGVYLPSSASERQEGEGGLSLAELQHAIREKNQGFEGFVIRFDSGLMYKIKTKWYCNINKALELVSSARSNAGSERSCWKCILEEKYDDLRAWLVEEDRRAMDEFSSRMVEEIDKNCAEMLQQVTELKQLYNNDRAKFARSLSSQPSSSSASVRKPILFKIWQQLDEEAKEVTVQDIRPWVVTMFLQGMAKRSTFEALRNALASGISYQTFLDKHWADKPKPTPNLDQ